MDYQHQMMHMDERQQHIVPHFCSDNISVLIWYKAADVLSCCMFVGYNATQCQ
jgi:hypothetical protein